MWVVGAVTKKELNALKKNGYEVERMVTKDELNKFCDPKYDPKTCTDIPEDDELYPLVWVDCDLVDVLNAKGIL